MTKPTHRVMHVVEFLFDEDRVREAYLSGETAFKIATRIGGHNHRTVYQFIQENKQAWLEEARFSRLHSDKRKIVMPMKVERAGGIVIMPVSVARISMHADYLEGRL